MLSVISWRNVWRSKSRSLILIGAIALGIWALIFALSFMQTFIHDYVDNAIREQYAHIQLHQKDFQINKDIQLDIDDGAAIAREIAAMEGVQNVTARSMISGMVSTANAGAGAQIFGVDPEQDAGVFGWNESMMTGEFLEGIKRNPVVIGNGLAKKLNADVNSKIILTFTDKNNNVVAGAFRVTGILDVTSPALDESAAFVRREDIGRLAGDEEMVHEIVVKLVDIEQLDAAHNSLAAEYPGLHVQTWKELAPELELIIGQSTVSLSIILGIIMAALGFGIVNTMLMAVLERVRELGMLMAIGMNKARVFLMVILETVMIALVGGPIGLILGFLTVRFLNYTGFDLTNFSAGLDEWGFSDILYPSLELRYYLIVAAAVVVTAVLGAIYPAWKAVRLKPVEALAKI